MAIHSRIPLCLQDREILDTSVDLPTKENDLKIPAEGIRCANVKYTVGRRL